jgi:hypothetical protein
VWLSKNSIYEKPYCATGAIMLTGSEQAPKSICTDRIIGTRKGMGIGNNEVGEEQ